MSLEAIAALLGHYAGDLVKLIMLGDCLVEPGQQSVEDFLAPGLALDGGVVALLFECGPELDGGLEERARSCRYRGWSWAEGRWRLRWWLRAGSGR
jgi:hypothetical protein